MTYTKIKASFLLLPFSISWVPESQSIFLSVMPGKASYGIFGGIIKGDDVQMTTQECFLKVMWQGN